MIDSLFPDGVVTATAGAAMWTAPLAPGEADAVSAASGKRRREFAAGRACARAALAKLGFEPAPLVADADRVPCWPEGAVGCISHSGDHCAAAVARRSRYAGVGLDVERRRALSSGVAERIAAPAELARLGALPPIAGADWPLVLFSAKESFYKCYFPLARVRLGFRDVRVELHADGTWVADLVRAGAPAAAGVRRVEGRFRVGAEIVATGVWLPA